MIYGSRSKMNDISHLAHSLIAIYQNRCVSASDRLDALSENPFSKISIVSISNRPRHYFMSRYLGV